MVYATCVTVLGQQRGSAGVGAWCAAAEAVLQWRISPAQAVGRRQCSGLGVTGSVSMRKVSAGQNKGRAWLCCAVVRSATADPRWVRRRGTGVRCSGPWGLLQATKAGLKGRGEGGEAHRGSTRKMARCRGVDGDVRRRGRCGARGRGCRSTPPGSWTPRVDSWSACERATAVRAVRGAPMVWNRHGGVTHRRRVAGSIPAQAWLEPGQASSV